MIGIFFIALMLCLFEISIRVLCAILKIYPKNLSELKFNQWMKVDPQLLFRGRSFYKGKIDSTDAVLNNLGLRDCDISPKKPGETRILCLGDSVIFGKDILQEDTFPKVLEKLLDKKYPGEYFVINAGISGYTVYQEFEFLKKYFDLLNPDLIIAGSNINDRRMARNIESTDNGEYFRRYYRNHRIKSIFLIFQYCYLISLIRFVFKKIFCRTKYKNFQFIPRVSPNRYRTLFEELVTFCRDRQRDVIFINFCDNPDRVRGIHNADKLRQDGKYQDALAQLQEIINDKFKCFKTLSFCVMAEIFKDLKDTAMQGEALVNAQKNVRFMVDVMGGPPVRTDLEYRKILKDVANNNSVPILEIFECWEKDGLNFTDFCHFDRDAHRIVSEKLFEITKNFYA